MRKKGKGLLNDPIFFFGVFSAVILSGILLFLPDFSVKSLTTWDFSFFIENSKNDVSASNLFAEPVKNVLKETPDMAFVEQNSILGLVPPDIGYSQVLGSIVGVNDESLGDGKSITEYVVEKGDNLAKIAEKFGVLSNTILWANELAKATDIKAGQTLVIPPVDGILYYVKKDDTLENIAKYYKSDIKKIISFNELSGEEDIYIGDILVLPGGQMPVVAKKPVYATTPQSPIASSYFICPHVACRITQRLHFYNAIDFAGQCGDSIVAAAGGIVQKVKFGWNGGGGNTISVLHPNGVVTTYGHIMSSLVTPGQQVSQGQIIALMGGKPGTAGAGISTGCHTHFQVIGARNPFSK